MDATGDPNSAYPLIRRGPNAWDKDQELRVVRLDVPWNSHRVHIQKSTSRNVMRRMEDKYLKKLLKEMISHTVAKKVMLITYQFLEDRAIKILKDNAPDREFLGYHFFGPRGVNDYKDCEAALVLGLPYANLNSAAQDGCILFPNKQDEDLRFDWPEATMQRELIQNIHRIRPVNKEKVDIVIAAKSWPRVFPKSDQFIDQSQLKSRKEIAIQRLEPFVKTFGFLNQDIGFLAGVYVKKKGPIAEEYRRKIFDPLNLYDDIKLSKNVDFDLSTFSSWEDCIISSCNGGLTNIQDNFDEIEQLNDLRRKWIFLIKNIYSKNLLSEDHITTINQLRIQSTGTNSPQREDIIILPENGQWAELRNYFKDIHPHFEEFTIKLPISRNNAVKGVGDEDRVKKFYRKMNSLIIFKKKEVDVNTYTVTNTSSNKLDPIPEGFVSIYVPAPNSGTIYLGYNDRLKTISLTSTTAELAGALKSVSKDQDTKIVTNDGKFIAMTLLESGLPKFEIIDVVSNQKMISNGEREVKLIDLNFALKQHGFPTDLEIRTIIRRLYDIWTKQEKLIYQLNLQKVFDLEKSLIWVTAKIERNGFPINTEKMLEYWIKAEEIFNKLHDELRRVFPSKISLLYDEKILAYLNRTLRLKLGKINEATLKRIKDPRVKEIIEKIFVYRKLKMDLDLIKKIDSYTCRDDRVRDPIDQISTKTGRIYRSLQSVKKDGSIRSFFQAPEGYKFIVADYSQQEARIMAALANDHNALEIFQDDKDLYLEVAKIMKDGTEEDHRKFRKWAKTIFLGQINGMTDWGTYLQLEKAGWQTDIDHVGHLLSNLYDEFDGIAKWQSGIVEKAKNDKFVSSNLGRRLKVDDDITNNSIVNFPIQATASDGFKLALLELDKNLEGLDALIVHIIHDEIIVEAQEDIVDEVFKMVKECMENAYEKMLPNCPFLVEPKITDSWG